MNNAKKNLKLRITQSIILVVSVMVIIFVAFCSDVLAQSPGDSKEVKTTTPPEVAQYALIAAAIAFGLSAVGAGIAISHVGAAAMGAVAEKPQIANWALIFIALGEGIVIFGFIIAVIILGKIQ